jgi:hypothetical protein
LAGLAVCAIAAIYLDHIRGRREIARREQKAATQQTILESKS